MPDFDSPFFGISSGVSFGPGYQQEEILAAPGAGNQVSYKMDGGDRYRILAVAGNYTTSAVVGNRSVYLFMYDQAGNLIWFMSPVTNVPASTSFNFCFNARQPVNVTTDPLYATYSFPLMLWPQASKIVIGAKAMDPGDVFQNLVLMYEKFPVGPKGYPVGFWPLG